jgi:thiol-disulfide isomerase/thioredoxin
MMKKVLFLATIALALVASSAIVNAAETKSAAKSMKPVLVGKDMVIEDCKERGIDDYVIFIYSKYCPHCKKAMPVVEGIVSEQKIGSRYLPIDTAGKEGRDLLDEFGIRVQYVPTLIKDCKAYVGGKSQETYEKVLRGK